MKPYFLAWPFVCFNSWPILFKAEPRGLQLTHINACSHKHTVADWQQYTDFCRSVFDPQWPLVGFQVASHMLIPSYPSILHDRLGWGDRKKEQKGRKMEWFRITSTWALLYAWTVFNNFDFILIVLLLSLYILLCIFYASSTPRCNAFILCKALWIALYMKCAIQITLTWLYLKIFSLILMERLSFFWPQSRRRVW